VIGIWIRRALSGEPILVYGDGEQTRAFSDIKYYMRPMHETMFKGDSCIFNMGADREYKIGDVAKIVQEVAKTRGYEVPIEYKEARHEVKHAYCDHAAAKKYLSLQDQTDIKKTIEEMFDWAKEIPERKVMNMNYEIEKGLYSFWR
jgi:UDP-glucose 4-epimerase